MFAPNNFSSQIASVEIGSKVLAAPRVSVVIPAYKIASFIAEALESVLAQTFASFEILLVNDGSPDTTEFEQAIARFRPYLVYIKQANGGAAAARNAAIERARGEFLAFLDGDDVWFPEFLASQIEFLIANNFDMVYANALIFGDPAQEDRTYMQRTVSNGAVTSESLLAWTCNVITSGTIVYREKLIAAGLFDVSPIWKRSQDFEMWFRLAKAGLRIGYQRKVLLKYRVRLGSLSGSREEQTYSTIITLRGVRDKYDLTAAEAEIWQKQIVVAEASWNVESGKAALKNGDFDRARKHFAKSVPFYSRPKAAAVNFALRLTPKLVQRLIRGYNLER